MIKLVIFDLDGTLLDTLKDLADACNHALEMCGCPHRTLDEYRHLIGGGVTKLLRHALPSEKQSDEMVQKMRSYFLPYYRENICVSTRPYDGIEELLETLSDAGIKLAIASNKFQTGTETLAENLLGRFEFIKVLGQREGCPVKPDPQIIRDVMTEIPDLKPEEVVYCGDSDVDMMTGHNAGIRSIGVSWGFRGKEELQACNPWIVVDSPAEIADAILK